MAKKPKSDDKFLTSKGKDGSVTVSRSVARNEDYKPNRFVKQLDMVVGAGVKKDREKAKAEDSRTKCMKIKK